MIDAKFKCRQCFAEWGNTSTATDPRSVASFFRSVQMCKRCGVRGQIIKMEPRK